MLLQVSDSGGAPASPLLLLQPSGLVKGREGDADAATTVILMQRHADRLQMSRVASNLIINRKYHTNLSTQQVPSVSAVHSC